MKNNIINFSIAEFARRLVKVNHYIRRDNPMFAQAIVCFRVF